MSVIVMSVSPPAHEGFKIHTFSPSFSGSDIDTFLFYFIYYL